MITRWIREGKTVAVGRLRYRVYYTQRGNVLLLLLVGGDKSTQENDIACAIRLARTWGEET